MMKKEKSSKPLLPPRSKIAAQEYQATKVIFQMSNPKMYSAELMERQRMVRNKELSLLQGLTLVTKTGMHQSPARTSLPRCNRRSSAGRNPSTMKNMPRQEDFT